MSGDQDTWKGLGRGNLILCIGNRVVSVATGTALILVLMYFNVHKFDIVGFFDELPIDAWQPLIASILLWIVIGYYAIELAILIWDLLLHRATRFRLTPDSVVKRGGVYRTYTHTIPGNRVQGVEVSASPFQRLVKVATVTITTAGVHSPNMTIKNLATKEAVAIQDQMGVDHA